MRHYIENHAHQSTHANSMQTYFLNRIDRKNDKKRNYTPQNHIGQKRIGRCDGIGARPEHKISPKQKSCYRYHWDKALFAIFHFEAFYQIEPLHQQNRYEWEPYSKHSQYQNEQIGHFGKTYLVGKNNNDAHIGRHQYRMKNQ